MKMFNIYVDKNNTYKAVKKGWSWPAFFFGSIWALFKGLWLLGIVLFPIELLLNMISNIVEKMSAKSPDHAEDYIVIAIAIIMLTIRIWFGKKGNIWRENKLLKGGFSFCKSLEANNEQNAIKLIQ